jgi:hypothetical protein
VRSPLIGIDVLLRKPARQRGLGCGAESLRRFEGLLQPRHRSLRHDQAARSKIAAMP